MKTWAILTAACLTGMALFVSEAQASGVNYRGPFEGRVVDQDTNKPIEGAVVFVRWDLQRITSPVFFDAKEVLTDKEGKFYIPAEWSWLPWRNYFLYSVMIIFKAGYGSVQLPGAPLDTTKETAKRLERLTLEQQRAIGPKMYYKIRFDDDVPDFLLKKLSTKEGYGNNTPLYGSAVPPEKRKLLKEEISRVDEVFRMEEEQRK